MATRRRAVQVASTLQGKKRRGMQDMLVEEDEYHLLTDEHPSATAKRALDVEKIMNRRMDDRAFVLDKTKNVGLLKEKQIDALLIKVNERISKSGKYANVFALLIFLVLYIVMLFLQNDVALMFSIESSTMNKITGHLPESKFLENEGDFWAWLEGPVVSNIFTDPFCGDGVCSGAEYAGFGRFGCIPDCGRYLKTTTITINLSPFANYTKEQYKWDWSKIPQPINPEYRWNIFSETMNDFIFAEDRQAGTGVVVAEVPDGKLTLQLFQTRKMSDAVDQTDIYEQLLLIPATLPERDAKIDWFYGDEREVLSSNAVLMKNINSYCYERDPSQTDMYCFLHPYVDTLFKVLGSYGLKGTVTVANGTQEATQLVNVDFCGVLKNGTQGVKNDCNKKMLQSAAISCGSRRASPYLHLSEEVAPPPPPEGSDALVRHLLQVKGFLESCTAHTQCDQTYKEDDYLTGATGMFCNSAGKCDTCSFCQTDALDSINKVCPTDLCPKSGSFPTCVDARVLTPNIQCKDAYDFEVYRYHPKGTSVSVAPPPQDLVRVVTPFNRLVGSIVLTTTKVTKGQCFAVQNRDVQNFTQGQCVTNELIDGTPTGMDPTYIATSSVYNGKLDVTQYYSMFERLNNTKQVVRNGVPFSITSASTPIGFFPHQYDQLKRAEKPTKEVWERDRNKFKAYLDGRASAEQIQAYYGYLRDGKFIDAETNTVEVELVTFNSQLNMFLYLSHIFTWKAGGSIAWDYQSQTVFMDLYTAKDPTGGRFGLEIFVIILLIINVCLEIRDMLFALRKFQVLGYFSSYGNWFDWLHFGFMTAGWIFWFSHHAKTKDFNILQSYPVLADTTSPSRYFATNSTEEYKFLEFVQTVKDRSGDFAYYTAITGICVVFFMMRVLKALDFQPRMGMITRTITTALPDLFHFTGMFLIVFVGYAICGTLCFGHQMDTMADVSKSMLLLIWMVFTMDKTIFYNQMSHAAPEWIFHLYLWSFMVVGYLVLFNIFLAILVDSFFTMKEAFHDKVKGVPDEIYDFSMHSLRRLIKPKDTFMSDQRVKEVLKSHKAGLPSTSSVRRAVLSTIDHKEAVILPGGVHVDRKWMWRLTHVFHDPTQPMPKKEQEESSKNKTWDSALVDGEDSSEDEEVHNLDEETSELVQDLIDRYTGEQGFDEDEVRGHGIQMMRIDNMKREMSMFRSQQAVVSKLVKMEQMLDGMMSRMLDLSKEENQLPHDVKKDLGPVQGDKNSDPVIQGSIKVVVVQAENLPSMDLLRAVDPYCIVFVTDTKGESEINESGTLRTSVVRKSLNPVWNEEFVMVVKSTSAALTLSLYDKDNITKDDFVGCVYVPLADLDPWNEHDEWYPVLNANLQKRMRDTRIRLKITLQTNKSVTRKVARTKSKTPKCMNSIKALRGPSGPAASKPGRLLSSIGASMRQMGGMRGGAEVTPLPAGAARGEEHA